MRTDTDFVGDRDQFVQGVDVHLAVARAGVDTAVVESLELLRRRKRRRVKLDQVPASQFFLVDEAITQHRSGE